MKRRLIFLASLLVCLSALLFMPATSSKGSGPQEVCYVTADGCRIICCQPNGWCMILEGNC